MNWRKDLIRIINKKRIEDIRKELKFFRIEFK